MNSSSPNFTHLVLLEPTDVLFFRDGRPMTGGLAGHGAAWPLPNVINAAFHGALHRGDLPDVHPHDHHGRNGASRDSRKFGSLLTAGPFPVFAGSASAPATVSGAPPHAGSHWFFPRPADLLLCDNGSRLEIALLPAGQWTPEKRSSLSAPLYLAVANCLAPWKETDAFQWLERTVYNNYLDENLKDPLPQHASLNDRDIFAAEFAVGIGIDPVTQTQDGEHIYSAHYLRLQSDWRLGVVAHCRDKGNGGPSRDLLAELLPDDQGRVRDANGQNRPAEESLGRIIVGGQQRLCSAVRHPACTLPLPRGRTSNFHCGGTGDRKRCFVKWVLLTAAIWPEITATELDTKTGKRKPKADSQGNPICRHAGGWLPNWVAEQALHDRAGNCFTAGDVVLTDGPGFEKAVRKGIGPGKPIHARLVAALVPKPIPVTGWSLEVPDVGDEGKPGAKTTHLAVPAGAIYYFETRGANPEEEAEKLAAALNWHGKLSANQCATEIKNRRSTLMGEKGFGLDVCGTWQPIDL